MKILYVDLQYDYGNKRRGLNSIGQDGFIKAFLRLNHEIDVFYFDSYLNQIDQLQKDIILKAEELQPDLIFFQTFTNQFKPKTLDNLKSKYETIAWFGDDAWRFDIYSKYLANHFTWCITTDKFSIPLYYKIGQKKVILSAWAAIDSHFIPEKKENYEFDVSFVGGINPYRQWFVDYLCKKGINIATFGVGWSNGKVSNERMNDIFMNSKINLSISNSESFDIRYLFHSPLRSKSLLNGNLKDKFRLLVAQAREWKKIVSKTRGNKIVDGIKARNFEIPFFGGFQLTNYCPGIEDYFIIGKEIACYNNAEDAILQIKYYLENEDERKEVVKKSHQIAKSNHGYIDRVRSILGQINGNQN